MIAVYDISVQWSVPWIALLLHSKRRKREETNYVHHACEFSIFCCTDKTSSGETPAGNCVTVDVNQSELDALVVRGYLSEEERDNGMAIKKAIEGVISDIVFELQSETAERTRARA